MRRANFLKLGRTLALASMGWFVVLGTAHATLGPSPAKTQEVSGLALALQEICSATGLSRENGESPATPAEGGLLSCTLCFAVGQMAMGFVPSVETPLPVLGSARASAFAHERSKNTYVTGLPPSRAPPFFLF